MRPGSWRSGGPAIFVAVAAYLGYRWYRDRQPSTAALLFIGCFCMFWQEFYADWGGLPLLQPRPPPASLAPHRPHHPEQTVVRAGRIFPFVFFATLVVWSLDRSDDRGRPWFERLARIPATAKGAQIARLGTWIIGMNRMYAATLTLPLVIIRSAFLHHDPFVP